MSANLDELVDQLVADLPPKETPPEKFLGEQYDRGLAWLHFPEGNGGLGLTPKDLYWLLIDRSSHLMVEWRFVLDGKKDPPSAFAWSDQPRRRT